MARRSASPEPQRSILAVDQMKSGVRRLQKRLDDLEAFDPLSIQERSAPEIRALEKAIDETLTAVYGHNTVEYNRYRSATRLDNGPYIIGKRHSPHEVQQYLTDGKKASILTLQQAIRGLEEEIAEQAHISVQTNSPMARLGLNRKVFVVHGREGEPREAVARFLERLEFEPIILHEKANQGRTIIEKIEAHNDVGFAVVLLTPDDVGGLSGETTQPRPRQNVLLELGYFIGRLGRDRVCAIKQGEMELPTDFSGVLWETFDGANNGWQQALGKELQAAGFGIDWNKVMRP
jgi:predicted nucleotide-binding protein